MQPITVDVLKQLTDAADWLLALPEKLVDSVTKPRETYLARKERIAKLKELAELREILKSVSRVMFFKGSLVTWVSVLQTSKKPSDAAELRTLVAEAAEGIADIAEAISETSLSANTLAAQAMVRCGIASTLLRQLANAPDEFLLSDETLRKLADDLEKLVSSSVALLSRIDDQRNILDHTYS